jgi:hypothetical protein
MGKIIFPEVSMQTTLYNESHFLNFQLIFLQLSKRGSKGTILPAFFEITQIECGDYKTQRLAGDFKF